MYQGKGKTIKIHKKELQQNSLSVGRPWYRPLLFSALTREDGWEVFCVMSELADTIFSIWPDSAWALLGHYHIGTKKLSLPFYLLIAKLSNIVQTENFETYLHNLLGKPKQIYLTNYSLIHRRTTILVFNLVWKDYFFRTILRHCELKQPYRPKV